MWNSNKSCMLVSLRDSLLPKLMKGEVRVMRGEVRVRVDEV